MTKPTEPAGAVQLGPQDLPELLANRQIEDPKTIKVLSDPLRLRMMRTLGEGARIEPRIWSVKQLAEALGEQPGKLYWHMKQLLAVGLIQVAEIGVVGGIIEQRYRVAQTSFWVDVDSLSGRPDHMRDTLALAEAAGTEFFAELRAAIEAGRAFISKEDSLAHPPHVRTSGTAADVRIPQAKAIEFSERLTALVDDFEACEHDPEGVSVNLMAFLYATE